MTQHLAPAAGAIGLLAGAACAQQDYSYTGPPVDIPDGSGTATPGVTASINITIPDAITISRLSCSIYVPHPFQGDLVITLAHVETGHLAMLVDRPDVPQTPLGFPASDYGTAAAMMQLDDTASMVYDVPGVVPPGIPGVSGPWLPQTPLGVFSGESALGTWRLSATDYAGGDTGQLVGFRVSIAAAGSCYPNCDGSTAQPLLNVNDFQCFLNKFAAADPYANCDGSTTPPVLNINDFQCYINKFAAGCT